MHMAISGNAVRISSLFLERTYMHFIASVAINILVTVDLFGNWCCLYTWEIGGTSLEILKCLSTIAPELLVLLSETNSSEQIPASHQLALVPTCQACVHDITSKAKGLHKRAIQAIWMHDYLILIHRARKNLSWTKGRKQCRTCILQAGFW
jgi:hypothetical protein